MAAPLILNFHGIGTPGRRFEEGEQPYWISADRFAEALDLLDRVGRRHPVLATFDDGNDSDHRIAFPALRERKRSAIVFVLAGKIGRPGYLDEAQLSEMAEAGFEIGSHGLHHRPWTSLGDEELAEETRDSRAILERVTGRPVTSAGLPFGRYDRRVLVAVRSAGYGAVYSSDGWPRLGGGAPLPRFSIRADTDLAVLERDMLAGAGLLRRAAQELKLALKAVR